MRDEEAAEQRAQPGGSKDIDTLDDAEFRRVDIVFTDLDGTFFPGAYEEVPQEEARMFRRNLKLAEQLEKELHIPVVPATGNNLGIAQMKFTSTAAKDKGAVLRDLKTTPGIYCNGALVKGVNGKEIAAEIVPKTFVEKLTQTAARFAEAVEPGACFAGLGRDVCWLLDVQQDAVRETGNKFLDRMGLLLAEDESSAASRRNSGEEGAPKFYEWVSDPAFLSSQDCDILSFLILFSNQGDSETPAAKEVRLLRAQAFLQAEGILDFGQHGAERLGNGVGEGVVCKHVHVYQGYPGIGPEIDISPDGVNKGSAIRKFLEAGAGENTGTAKTVAVFGDAGNDLELFGVKRGPSAELLPLFQDGFDYRPKIRVAMPLSTLTDVSGSEKQVQDEICTDRQKSRCAELIEHKGIYNTENERNENEICNDFLFLQGTRAVFANIFDVVLYLYPDPLTCIALGE
ncbi:unnamed protein product [Amoebophrya sp. A120]|nr:unnamed protein product [Amoebophrya sp. A120]|eukprot:GSA120T00024016001.1